MSRNILILAALGALSLTACDPGASSAPPPASATPEGKLCTRAYNQTIDMLEDMLKKQGVKMPPPPSKDGYVDACIAAGFSEAQAKCLDPKWSSVNGEECEKELEPKKAEKAKLDGMFAAALKAKPEEKPAEGEGEPPPDAGAAVEAALSGE